MIDTNKARGLRAHLSMSVMRLIDEVGLDMAVGYTIRIIGEQVEAHAAGEGDPVMEGAIKEMEHMLEATEVVRKL